MVIDSIEAIVVSRCKWPTYNVESLYSLIGDFGKSQNK